MAFLKNRFSLILFGSIIFLAFIGLTVNLIKNPSGFFLNIVVMVAVGGIIWFVYRHLSTSSPQKREQKAFLKAAKQSKKRLQTKDRSSSGQQQSTKTSSIKANKHKRSKSTAHLTVIEGKKSKKKNRASL
ncbi:SA1362 family protein [Niallia circulans]|uniref:SA1362 family protein n=1 Tax=Niallia circulans TaxID=1397 RepID=UPI00201D87FE|nr:SA1362 family protein [Niallia circulans]